VQRVNDVHLGAGLLQVPGTVAAYSKCEQEMHGEELRAFVAEEMSGAVAPMSFSEMRCEVPTCALSRSPHRSQITLNLFAARP
jgi:hypothetical protein